MKLTFKNITALIFGVILLVGVFFETGAFTTVSIFLLIKIQSEIQKSLDKFISGCQELTELLKSGENHESK
jgi:ABC-type protease/lipase transport system fused ATPase/permease subunit